MAGKNAKNTKVKNVPKESVRENKVELFDDGETITLYDDKEKPVEFVQVRIFLRPLQ